MSRREDKRISIDLSVTGRLDVKNRVQERGNNNNNALVLLIALWRFIVRPMCVFLFFCFVVCWSFCFKANFLFHSRQMIVVGSCLRCVVLSFMKFIPGTNDWVSE